MNALLIPVPPGTLRALSARPDAAVVLRSLKYGWPPYVAMYALTQMIPFPPIASAVDIVSLPFLIPFMIYFFLSNMIAYYAGFLASRKACFGLHTNIIQDIFKYLPVMFVFYCLFTILVFIGLLLFIIPGIYFGTVISLVPYLFIHHNMSIYEAIKKSWNMTIERKRELFVYSFRLTMCLFFVGFFIGMIARLPQQLMLSAVNNDILA
jgi:hypothetical protein